MVKTATDHNGDMFGRRQMRGDGRSEGATGLEDVETLTGDGANGHAGQPVSPPRAKI